MDNTFGQDVKIYRDAIIRSSQLGNNVIVGDDCFITGSVLGDHCSIERRGMVFNSIIGDYSYTGYNSVVKYASVGKFCSISWNVSIGGADHDVRHLTTHPFPFISKYGFADKTENYDSFDEKLQIGNDVWIGSNVCILRGITIGDGAVIGAGAVVTHDVGSYEIWAGVPAKKIGQRFDDKIIERLCGSGGWFDFPEEFLKENLQLFKENVTLELVDEFYDRYKRYMNGEL